MNRILISSAGIEELPWFAAAAEFLDLALHTLGKDDWILSVVFCGDEFIRNLNLEYRRKDEPTDVLSFSMGDTVEEEGKTWTLAGDIVVSLPALGRNVSEFHVSQNEELKRLLLHGILHLGGMDHENNDPAQPMLLEQEEILATLEGAKIL
jgi:probable rRNA maturation factor